MLKEDFTLKVTPVDILRKTRSFIEEEKQWTQNTWAMKSAIPRIWTPLTEQGFVLPVRRIVLSEN